MILLFLALASLLGLSSKKNERHFSAQVEMGALDANGGSLSDAYNVKLISSLDGRLHFVFYQKPFFSIPFKKRSETMII